ncbi:GNAT family N-acetyltransferase [Halovenus rubra]|uniref:GNAT family N-acetyltransferase n=2 Tax=Halovenus rubra TaxID=869890 RepID=A0ABD5X4U2_9EURY|nr:GNAT family N-acetyltransferase [Halovenus rubra]
MHVRTATTDDVPALRNVLDGGLLALNSIPLTAAVKTDSVLVAVRDGDMSPVLGVVVLDGSEIAAIAVRQRRRGQGIGTALIEAASQRHDTLQADFHRRVRPFWESLGFSITPTDEEDRFYGHVETTDTVFE